jgi:RNA polymerase sigma factor for flagellar operon FliA
MSTTAAKQARTNKNVRRDELVMEHLSLVSAIAARVRESLPVHVEMDDLIHAGIIGLIDAAEKFESDKQVAFGAYAKHRIRGSILDSLRNLDWASRDLRRRQKQLEQITRELTLKLDRQPTEKELAEAMGVSPSRWKQLLVELHNVSVAATQNYKFEQESDAPVEPPCARETHPDRMFARSEIRSHLRGAIAELPKRYQDVVTLYYDRDLTMKEIGSALGVNESRVSQIHKLALARMQASLQQSGIQSAVAY